MFGLRGQAAVSLTLDEGSRISISTSALGRAFLAARTEEERAPILNEIRAIDEIAWPQTRDAIEKAIEDHRTLGCTCSFGEWRNNVNAIAVGFRPGGGMPAMAVNCGAPGMVVSPDFLLNEVRPKLVALGRRLEGACFQFPRPPPPACAGTGLAGDRLRGDRLRGGPGRDVVLHESAERLGAAVRDRRKPHPPRADAWLNYGPSLGQFIADPAGHWSDGGNRQATVDIAATARDILNVYVSAIGGQIITMKIIIDNPCALSADIVMRDNIRTLRVSTHLDLAEDANGNLSSELEKLVQQAQEARDENFPSIPRIDIVRVALH